ncbi:MAG: helix-turn-helix domain protein [Bacteroidetes bacterium]|jgi:transcriptional regulator with XRE-family HTH domain|nr:helix-turn-helix domain protein [Bacteroidota bacterium]
MKLQEIGKQLKERRTVLHLQQKDLSEMSGVSLRTIIQVENGVGNPALKTLQKLAEVLGMEILLTIKTK